MWRENRAFDEYNEYLRPHCGFSHSSYECTAYVRNQFSRLRSGSGQAMSERVRIYVHVPMQESAIASCHQLNYCDEVVVVGRANMYGTKHNDAMLIRAPQFIRKIEHVARRPRIFHTKKMCICFSLGRQQTNHNNNKNGKYETRSMVCHHLVLALRGWYDINVSERQWAERENRKKTLVYNSLRYTRISIFNKYQETNILYSHI